MGSPAIFSGKYTKLLTQKGIQNSDGTINQFDGGINYIKNSHFEFGVEGWATYADVAGIEPVDGTGGAANITLTRNTTTPLMGAADGLITKDAVNRQGQGVSYDFTVDNALTGKNRYLGLKFAYKTSVNFVLGDLIVYVYDVTNSKLVSGFIRLAEAIGPDLSQALVFQCTGATQYRLCLHVASTSALAWAVNVDDLELTDNSFGMVSTIEQQTYHIAQPQNAMTDVTNEVRYNLATATITQSGSALFTVTDDAANARTVMTVLKNCAATFHVAGYMTGVGNLIDVLVNGSLVRGYSDSAYGALASGGSSASYPLKAGDKVTIQGYNAVSGTYAGNLNFSVTAIASRENVILEGEGMKRVAVYAQGNAGQAITASVTDIPFTEVTDTKEIWDGSKLTANEDGDFTFSGSLSFTTVQNYQAYLYIDGVVAKQLVSITGVASFGFSGDVYLLKGQTASIRINRAATLLNNNEHNISIVKLATIDKPIYAVPASKENNKTYDKTLVGVTASGWTTDTAEFFPYRTISKVTGLPVWRLAFNITGAVTSSTRTSFVINITGVIFGGITYSQAISAQGGSGAGPCYAYATPNTQTVSINHASGTTSHYEVSGDVELASKPTWADEWNEQGVMIAGAVARERVAYLRANTNTTQTSLLASTTAYKTRNLSSVEGDTDIVSIASNRATLQAGEYEIEVPVGAYNNPNWIYFRLYNYTDSTVVKEFTDVALSQYTVAAMNVVRFRLNVFSAKEFEFQTASVSAAGGSEVLSTIKIRKLLGDN